jgi:hypothetical protein
MFCHRLDIVPVQLQHYIGPVVKKQEIFQKKKNLPVGLFGSTFQLD